ncbi:hypothetical protein Tco_0993916 [Tanacetum coccineum]
MPFYSHLLHPSAKDPRIVEQPGCKNERPIVYRGQKDMARDLTSNLRCECMSDWLRDKGFDSAAGNRVMLIRRVLLPKPVKLKFLSQAFLRKEKFSVTWRDIGVEVLIAWEYSVRNEMLSGAVPGLEGNLCS